MDIDNKNNENSANKCRIIIYFIALLCIISNISYYPYFQQTNWARYVVIVCWSIILLYTLFIGSILPVSKYYNKQSLFLVIYVFMSIFLFLIGQIKIFINHFFLIVIISFLIFTISAKIGENINFHEIKIILYTYSFSTAIISVPLYFFYLRSYDLSSIIYQYRYGKNEMAILIMCSIIIIGLYFKPIKKYQVIIKYTSLLMLMLDIMYLRCRSAMLGILICFILYIKHLKINTCIKYISLVILIIIIVISQLNKLETFRDDVLFAGRNSYDLDDLSSGRITQINYGLTLLKENLLIGIGNSRTIDCLYVSALVNYGIIFFLPLISLALYPIIYSIYNYYCHSDNLIPEDICFLALALSMFTTSCLEELAPFGPGTRCYIFWLMFGFMINIKRRHENEYNNEKNFT